MYDYVIVGGGSAGCVLAERLSAQPDIRVLLLEAGGSDRRPEVQIPSGFPKLFGSDADWSFLTEEDPTLGGRQIQIPMGKLLGGSSSLDPMLYLRGRPEIYDRWSESGCRGWSFDDLLPHFLELEDNARGESEYHGTGGPLSVADPPRLNSLSRAFLESAQGLGIASNPDFNGRTLEGAGAFQMTRKSGQRWSAADAFLHPALERPNLTLLAHAQATRLVFDGHEVCGIEYTHDGKVLEARAEAEVILCAGAIQSPALLLRSGIGPADHLRELDLIIHADLPGVGRNLQDHLSVALAYASKRPGTLAGAGRLRSRLRYALRKHGPLASNIVEAGAFLRVRPEATSADMLVLFAPDYFIRHGQVKPEGHGFTLAPTLLRPRSRGRLRLRSLDPLDLPLIEGRFLEDEADLETLYGGFVEAQKIAKLEPLDKYRGEEFLPGADVGSEEDVKKYIRRNAEAFYHPVGTCKMGIDFRAVVDPTLRVRGLKGLRVADASVFPTLVGAPSAAPVMALAARAADLILSGTRWPATASRPAAPAQA